MYYGTVYVFHMYMYSHVPEPEYTIIREPVVGDIPEYLVLEVHLPKVVSAMPVTSHSKPIYQPLTFLYTASISPFSIVILK